MSRTIIEVPRKMNTVDDVLRIVASKLEPAGFEQKIVDGETVWSKGDGVILMMQCVGIVFTEKTVLIQGWMKSVSTGEYSLDGFAAIIPKRKLKKLIDVISTMIQ